ncbi:methyl-accepting chemotaxis protein [Delftia sp. PS-11]|uniref:methyl-accepting chemotaxis protein n=1 Tax=Delftia sp. PS-11 TaxID=2767222 RepID=UPI002456783D|nr:methyl-accepting chemotaxis protein [Delftia sp. PS-11]
MANLVQRTTVIQKRFAEIEVSEQGRALQDRMADVRKAYLDVRQKLENVGADEQTRHALVLSMKEISGRYVNEAQALVAFEERRGRQLSEDIANSLSLASKVLVWATVCAIAVAAWLGWAISHGITSALRALQSTARRIAEGDLTADVQQPRGRSELALLAMDVGRMQDALRDLVSQAREASNAIGQATSEAAHGNVELSSRTEQAASSLEQTASAMEELTSTVRQSADSAQTASQLAVSAAEVAQRGGLLMQDVVNTMQQIDQSSRKIADIISVIDGIAFQTNILALNAAVEAARAGEQGRGFAVVASEVRSLAQRSADAAKEIKLLIATSVERVEAGSLLVENAGAIIHDIVSSVDRVRSIVGEISVASGEQSRGIGEVNVAVSQLDHMTQQNAALVQQTSAATDSLGQRAQALGQVISRFQVSARVAPLARLAIAGQ